MNEELNNMLNAVGAIAELLHAHYDAFIKAGFDEKQAMDLTLPLSVMIFSNSYMPSKENE